MTEREAHDEILRRCRRTGLGRWVMRISPAYKGGHAVVDLASREPRSRGFNTEWADRRIAEGGSWLEVLAAMDFEDRKLRAAAGVK